MITELVEMFPWTIPLSCRHCRPFRISASMSRTQASDRVHGPFSIKLAKVYFWSDDIFRAMIKRVLLNPFRTFWNISGGADVKETERKLNKRNPCLVSSSHHQNMTRNDQKNYILWSRYCKQHFPRNMQKPILERRKKCPKVHLICCTIGTSVTQAIT